MAWAKTSTYLFSLLFSLLHSLFHCFNVAHGDELGGPLLIFDFSKWLILLAFAIGPFSIFASLTFSFVPDPAASAV